MLFKYYLKMNLRGVAWAAKCDMVQQKCFTCWNQKCCKPISIANISPSF